MAAGKFPKNSTLLNSMNVVSKKIELGEMSENIENADEEEYNATSYCDPEGSKSEGGEILQLTLRGIQCLQRVKEPLNQAEEDAIRKILRQDSSKKKKEDQRKKRLEELAQMKASNTVRVIMAPIGHLYHFGRIVFQVYSPQNLPGKSPAYGSCQHNHLFFTNIKAVFGLEKI
uniref:Uncharacterized protein n=2 Tax=Kalanchoe fedtschenkoi TaxID=63787 RepID=A0A7N0ZW46_KALFE